LETEAQEAFREKQHLIVVFLDLEKAYEKMTIDNGVVQGAVLSVTLFLIAISEMANKTKEPHKYFIQGITRCCGPKIICKQHSIEWQNGLRQMASESPRKKTKAMHTCRIRSKPENHPDPTIRLNGQILEVVDTHTQNTEVYTGQTTNMETTHRNSGKMQLETEPFETSGAYPMGADQSTLLRVHKMLVLLAVAQPGKHN
jgi:hypothetical protein